MKKCELDGEPHIYLKACANIVDGEELRYDYGDTDLPQCIHVRNLYEWLFQVKSNFCFLYIYIYF